MMSDPFSVVRQAHRICAAYYQQILPLLNETAHRLDTVFVQWDTWSFNLPPQRNKNPFNSWEWDFLPIMDLSFVFSRQQEPGAAMGTEDFVIDFKLVTDSELSWEQRAKHYGENEKPIASALKTAPEDAESYLCVYLFAADKKGVYDSPYTLWDSYSGYPQTDGSVALSDEDQLKGIGFKMPLHELAHDGSGDELVARINANLTILQAYKTPSRPPAKRT